MNIIARLKNLERQLHGRSCAACANAPRSVVIRSERDREAFDRQMRERRELCTCGQKFYVRVINILRHSAVAA